MRKNLIILLSISILALAGCGGDSNPSQNENTDKGILSNLGGSKFYSDEDIEKLEACELLTLEMVLENANGVAESDITGFDMFGCSYSWEKADAAEIEARNDQKILDNGFQNIASLDLESSENEISLSFNDFYIPQSDEAIDNTYRSLTNQLTQSEKDNNSKVLKDAFNSIGTGDNTDDKVSEVANELGAGEAVQEKLEEGFTDAEKDLGNSFIDLATSTEDQDVYKEVSGLGDKAAWSEFSNEIVVQYNNFIFNLEVELDSNSEQVAIELAKEILEKAKKEL